MDRRGVKVLALGDVTKPLDVRPAVTVLRARLAPLALSFPPRAAAAGEPHVVLSELCQGEVVDAVRARQEINTHMSAGKKGRRKRSTD